MSTMITTIKKSLTALSAPAIAKLITLAVLLTTPFWSYMKLGFLQHISFKVLFLIAIIALCFYDFQLALLLTIIFLVIIINGNHVKIVKSKLNGGSLIEDTKEEFNIAENLPNEECSSFKKNEINKDLVAHYIDDKIKPYEVYIKMLVNEEALADASNGALAVEQASEEPVANA
jgi:hypothetical protein